MDTAQRHKTWLITGAGSGLGRALAEAALDAGDRVVGTGRRPERLDDLSSRYPDRFSAVAHDVRDTEGAAAVVAHAAARFGGVDVLVNNAGVGQVGAAEEVTGDELRDMLDQHLFGPAAFVRAVLPGMREARSGAIVQMSSQGGRMSFPGVGSYSAGKFALEGWSEALAGEVAPFGIRVLIVEPSRFRTQFNAGDVLRGATQNAAYDGVVAAVRADMAGADGRQEGDPVRAAAIIRRVLQEPDAPLRLALGAEAVKNLTAAHERGLVEIRRWAELSASADFPGQSPAARAF
jgi:NAD(P)-dependent dehydrogenase (short-subunit alcohol dehydrogenase family)